MSSKINKKSPVQDSSELANSVQDSSVQENDYDAQVNALNNLDRKHIQLNESIV